MEVRIGIDEGLEDPAVAVPLAQEDTIGPAAARRLPGPNSDARSIR